MSLNYNELLARCAAWQIEILGDLGVNADAKAYFFHTQESFPYFTNRIAGDDVGASSEEFDDDTIQVAMRLIVAHATEGYAGQPEDTLYDYMPEIKLRFNQNPFLISTGDYSTAMIDLMEARVTSHTGLRAFQNAGISAVQVGCEFTLTCTFVERLTLEYN